ncbi:protein GVQW3-like [Haliotis cracherodii]|uniref:protein GVQW3-like n=1 Tax=Haliotis cracherodii TaxID=6455 RepID=UPI0039EB8C0A
MEKQEKRAVIKYLYKKGLTPNAIYEDMLSTLGEDAPSYATVKRWVAEFKRGRSSTYDEPRPGPPVVSSTPEMVQRILDIVMDDRRVTQRQIANLVDISQERVHFILTDILGMHKVSARWVPKLLTADQKRQRENLSRENLKLLEGDPDNFLKRFVTMDETWVHHFEPESKQQSKQWQHVTSPTPLMMSITGLPGIDSII